MARKRLPLTITVTHSSVCKKKRVTFTVMHFGKRHSGGFKDINVNLEVFFLVVVLLYMPMNFCLLLITNVLSVDFLFVNNYFLVNLKKKFKNFAQTSLVTIISNHT